VVDFTLPPTKVVTFALFSGGTIFPAALILQNCSVGLAISIVEDLN
jgi:hypothetical protein